MNKYIWLIISLTSFILGVLNYQNESINLFLLSLISSNQVSICELKERNKINE